MSHFLQLIPVRDETIRFIFKRKNQQHLRIGRDMCFQSEQQTKREKEDFSELCQQFIKMRVTKKKKK